MSHARQGSSRLEQALRAHAARDPSRIALRQGSASISYGQLIREVDDVRAKLEILGNGRPIALMADNGLGWVVTDLAAHVAGIPIVPIATFFSGEQVAHVVATAGIGHLVTDQPGRFAGMHGTAMSGAPLHRGLHRIELGGGTGGTLPDGVTKITFTSGTTGQPKGVCLKREEIEQVAVSLRAAVCAVAEDQHVCLLPLATLLENIGGVYVPLLAGATVNVPALSEVGLSGSSSFDVLAAIATLGYCKATSAITVPQMLSAFVAAARAGVSMPPSLRYLAVGGAPVSTRSLERAIAAGLPVFEGYGLSECASVLAVNRPGQQRTGSVGKPLDHVELCFAEDSEIFVCRRGWAGYLGDADGQPDFFATGDTGYQDRDGYLYITARKKNMFISAFGRNVSPDWIESELLVHPSIAQVAVFGEGRPFNTAVIVAPPSASRSEIEAAIADTNRRLPDYARVSKWTAAREPFSTANGLLTSNGKLRRDALVARYAQALNTLYPSEDQVVTQ
ncbi:MAG: AMP-binding protein [Burkholderiaceae bacterium]